MFQANGARQIRKTLIGEKELDRAPRRLLKGSGRAVERRVATKTLLLVDAPGKRMADARIGFSNGNIEPCTRRVEGGAHGCPGHGFSSLNRGVSPRDWIIQPTKSHREFSRKTLVGCFPSLVGNGLIDVDGSTGGQSPIVSAQGEVMAVASMVNSHRKLMVSIRVKGICVFSVNQTLSPVLGIESVIGHGRQAWGNVGFRRFAVGRDR